MGEAEQTVHEYLLEGSDIVDVARRLSPMPWITVSRFFTRCDNSRSREFVVLLDFLAFGCPSRR